VSEELHCWAESLVGHVIPGTDAHSGTFSFMREASSDAKSLSMSAKLFFILCYKDKNAYIVTL
jgi:hypothetical protein